MTNPTAAMLVIGDEILSGRTRDSNMHFLAGELTRTGIPLCEVRVVADIHAEIVAATRALSARGMRRIHKGMATLSSALNSGSR